MTSNRGGKRAGAGRPTGTGKYSEPTRVLRVPESQVDHVREFLSAQYEARRTEIPSNVVSLHQVNLQHESRLPVYTTKVAAGFPSPADDHVEDRLSPGSYLIENESSTFFVRVKGDSMVDAGLFDHDVLVVDRSRNAKVGDIVLAVVDGEFTVKTLGHDRSGPVLIPANKHYRTIHIKEGQSFEVWGVVTGSMRKFK